MATDTTSNVTNPQHAAPIKPLYMLRNEFMNTLINAANDCQLPFVIMEYVVRDFYEEVRNTAARQYENEKEEYENALKRVENGQTSDGTDV